MNLSIPTKNATDSSLNVISPNLYHLRRGQYPDSVDTSNQIAMSENNIQPLPNLPERNYSLPVQKRSIANKDNPWEDTIGTIVNRQVNPKLEGTPQAFGGTAGSILAPDPKTLPKIPSENKIPDSPIDESNRNIAVLNRNSTFTLSDYERVMLMKERDNLQQFSDEANYHLKKRAESERFYNLSLEEIVRNTILTIITVFVDLINHFSSEAQKERENMSFTERASVLSIIFIKDNRLIYLGTFMVFLSILFMIVFLSS
jgi:hypothetical protein